MEEYRIPVFDDKGTVVGRVRYNQDLDFWDGRNFSCGSLGRHKGIAKLKDGRFVLIYGSEWEGETDHADIISDEDALKEIFKSRSFELLQLEKYKPLKELYAKTVFEEEEETEAIQ